MTDDTDLDEQEKPGIAALLGQLSDDATNFAKAEMRLLQAQAGERASIAIPALFMLAASGVLMLAIVVAVVIAALFVLAPFTGMAIAALIVIIVSGVIAYLLFRAGRERMRRVFRKLEA
jgi:ABC-type siderophore export system fused ATPase/permease subunit